MSDTIRVGIAGQGRSGYKIHAACLKNMTDTFTIAAIADPIEDRFRDGETILKAKSYHDYREMIAAGGFDLFVNALPSHMHVDATLEALEAGYHVVSEKPMAGNVRDFDRMVEASKKYRRLLAPFQNNRLQPFFDKIQDVIASGVLGKIIHIRSSWSGFSRRWDWQTRQENLGGSLFNTGPHAVDQALVLFGNEREPEVFCRMDCNNQLGGDAEDFCTLTLFDRERKAPTIEILISSYLYYPPPFAYTICGTYGNLVAGATEAKWAYYDPKQAPQQPFWMNWSEDRQYPKEKLDWFEETWKVDSNLLEGAVGYTLPSLATGAQKFYHNMFDVLRKNGELLITLPQVRRQIAIIEECHRQNPLPRKSHPGKLSFPQCQGA